MNSTAGNSTTETGSDARVREVLDTWFGPMNDGLCSAERRSAMFRADPAQDAMLRTRFGTDVERALDGDLDQWAMSAAGRLALVVLLDQFTRNIFRGSARAWAGDDAALRLAREGVGRGDDSLLPTEQRVFLYLPFEHSESLADQDTCVLLVERLRNAQPAGADAVAVLDNYLQHAVEHRDLIVRFGRFPHRNRALGRESTAQERDYLEADGRSYGQ